MRKVCLFVIGQKGLFTIKGLVVDGISGHISKVVIGRDLNIENDFFDEIVSICRNNNIQWHLRKKDILIEDSEFCVFIAWKWLIKDEEIVRKSIIIHDSLLPKYRGFNPLVTALINGDSDIGVTALFASHFADQGLVIKQLKIKITYPLKIADAIGEINSLYHEIVSWLISEICVGNKWPEGVVQNESLATYSIWRDEKDYFIDWNQDSESILRFINSVGSPYNGAQFIIGNDLVTVGDAECVTDKIISNRSAGKLLEVNGDSAVVICGVGLLKIFNCTINVNGEKYKFTKLRTRLGSIQQTPPHR